MISRGRDVVVFRKKSEKQLKPRKQAQKRKLISKAKGRKNLEGKIISTGKRRRGPVAKKGSGGMESRKNKLGGLRGVIGDTEFKL